VLSAATKMLHRSAFGVEFITPLGLASDSGVGELVLQDVHHFHSSTRCDGNEESLQ